MKNLFIATALVGLFMSSCTKTVLVGKSLKGLAQGNEVTLPPLKLISTAAYGSSSVALWPGLQTGVLGIPVSQFGYNGLSWMDLRYKVPTGYQQIIFYAGDNDAVRTDITAAKMQDRFIASVTAVANANPNARIIVIPLKPSPYLIKIRSLGWIETVNNNIRLYIQGGGLRNYAPKPNMVYASDCYAQFFTYGPTGKILKSYLFDVNSVHLKPDGYKLVWNVQTPKYMLRQ